MHTFKANKIGKDCDPNTQEKNKGDQNVITSCPIPENILTQGQVLTFLNTINTNKIISNGAKKPAQDDTSSSSSDSDSDSDDEESSELSIVRRA